MSISTRTGDNGTTGLIYGKRVPKFALRIETVGTLDELNAALGMVRANTNDSLVQTELLRVQKNLVALMGELAVAPEDAARYEADQAAGKYPQVRAAELAQLDELVADLEKKEISFYKWATPGENLPSATLDVARTVARRAERRVVELGQTPGEGTVAPELVHYLNRLSDVLWLLARWMETTKSPNP